MPINWTASEAMVNSGKVGFGKLSKTDANRVRIIPFHFNGEDRIFFPQWEGNILDKEGKKIWIKRPGTAKPFESILSSLKVTDLNVLRDIKGSIKYYANVVIRPSNFVQKLGFNEAWVKQLNDIGSIYGENMLDLENGYDIILKKSGTENNSPYKVMADPKPSPVGVDLDGLELNLFETMPDGTSDEEIEEYKKYLLKKYGAK